MSNPESRHESPPTAVEPKADEEPDSASLVGALFDAREQLRLAREREEALVSRTLDAEKRMWRAIEGHRTMQAEIDRIEGSRFFRLASIGWDTIKKIRRTQATLARLLRGKSPAAAAAAEAPAEAHAADSRPPTADAEPVAEVLATDFEKGPAAEVARRFSHFRTEKNPHYFRALVRHLQSLVDNPCLPMYFEFAATCNERGEKVVRALGSRVSVAGKRYLDIGCAYGGFVVAFARRGAEAVGIDLDEHLLRLAGANFRDHGVSARLLKKDVTRAEDIADLGTFDLITANDVLEHVLDPEGTIRHLDQLLRPGGAAYLEIPNRYFADFVRQDGHFQLFGITLLERADAERYYGFHAPGVRYDVGHYLDLEQYLGMLGEAGLRAEILRDPEDGDPVGRVLQVGREIRRDMPQLLATVPEPMRATVEAKASAYLDGLEAAPRRGWKARGEFRLRYGTAFWRILAHKPGAGSAS